MAHCNDFKAREDSPGNTQPPPVATVQKAPGVANQHGDVYPEEAGPIAEGLPARVRKYQENSQLVGYPEFGGRSFGRITANRDDSWTEEARKYMRERGYPIALANRLANHVEIKTAMMMARTDEKHGTLVINHAPCGSEPGEREGCDRVLPGIVPPGGTLTVLGTDANGNPFKRVYEGTT